MYLSGSYENLRKHFVARTTNATCLSLSHITYTCGHPLIFFTSEFVCIAIFVQILCKIAFMQYCHFCSNSL